MKRTVSLLILVVLVLAVAVYDAAGAPFASFARGDDIHDQTALKVFGADSTLSAHELRRLVPIVPTPAGSRVRRSSGEGGAAPGRDGAPSTRSVQAG